MIIQCEQCSTKFRLDDARVKDKGVKVRCAKCRHVFSVKKLQESGAPPGAVAGIEQPAGYPFAGPAAGDEFPFVPPAEDSSVQFGEKEVGGSFSTEVKGPAAGHDEAAELSGGADASDFDFGAAAVDKVTVSGPEAAESGMGSLHGAATVPAADADGFDFSDESLFGEFTATPAPGEPAEPASFGFLDEAVADSTGTDKKVPGWQGGGGGLHAAKADEPFSPDEFDFGDELTSEPVRQVSPVEPGPALKPSFAPLSGAQGKKGDAAGEEPAALSAPHEELPPLSIPSRRKQSPLFMGLAIALVVAVVGYVGYSMFGEEKVTKEKGRISIRGVHAAFVNNSGAGELLVLSGEAVNEFAGPRAAIQVKGMVYGPDGQVLASKSAFCGNPLAREQLATMPLDRIESAMANQFGDSLANMEVPPGKSIPFVIVMVKPPATARDYGVEPAGSTVSTGKQP